MSVLALGPKSLSSLLSNFRWHQQVLSFYQKKLPLRFASKRSLKSSHKNQARWSGIRKENYQEEFSLSRLWKPFGFTIVVSGVSLAGAAIWQYESVRHRASLSRNWGDIFRQSPKYGQLRQHLNKWWSHLTAADKVFCTICAINMAVFIAWRVPRWQGFMCRYFLSGLSSNVLCWPMLFSVFSHSNIFHLGANMMVLHSFSEKAVSALGREQFVGFYLTAGMISSFTSYLFKTLIRSNRMSLGASGAVMGVLGFVCMKYPNTQLAIIFLPQFPFSAQTGLTGLIGLDITGCLLRWTIMDHAAHLGGSLFGICWYYWGYELIWKKREPLVTAWHTLRGPVS